MAGLLDPESLQNVPILGGLLGSIARGYDPSAAYTGSLARNASGKMDPAVEDAFRIRALGAMAGAFGEGQMPVPIKGGIPFLATLGKAAGAAATAGDPLVEARLRAAQSQQALAAAHLSEGQYGLLGTLGPAYQALIDAGKKAQGGGTDASGKPTTGPAKYTGVGGGGGSAINPAEIYHYALTLPGANPNRAAMLTASVMAESSGKPDEPHDGGIGYGLFGHNTDRLQGMYEFAGLPKGTAIGTPVPWQKQVAFANDELNRNVFGAGKMVDAATNADQLTEAQLAFEHPKGWDTGGGNREQRLAYTKQFLTNPPPPPTPPQTAAAVPQPPGPDQPTNIATPTPPVGAAAPAPALPGGALAPGAEGNPGPVSGLLGPQGQPGPAIGPNGGLLAGAPELSPQAQAIMEGINRARAEGGAAPGVMVAGPGAAEAPSPPPARPPMPTPDQMGQEGGGIPGLLGGPGAPVTPPAATPAQPAPAASGPPPVGPPPALPPVSVQMPPLPPFNPPQATPQQQIAQGIAGISSLIGHPAPDFVQKLANMPTELALEQGKAYINMVTQGMNERDKARIQAIMEPYLAAAKAAAELPYKPERVAPGAGVSMGGQPPQWYAPEHQTAFNPATQREEFVTVTKQPDGTSKYDWSGIPAKPSAAETSAGTAAGPYTPAAVPGAAVKGPPGTPPIYPQNPDPTKNIQTPTGTTIPAPTNQVLPQNYSDYGKQQENWNNRREDLVNAQTLSAGAETKIRMMIDAAKVNQMGTGSEARAHLGGLLISLGADQKWVNENITNVGAVQQFLYGQARETLGTLAAVNKRFTGGEFKITSQSGAGTEYLNEANLPILADDLARVRQLQMVSQDFNRAQTIRYADGSYWNNPESFISQWYGANPLGKIKAQTMQQIGPLAGMTGVPGVPKEAVPTGKSVGGWPVFRMPDGREGTFPGEWR